MDAVRAEGLTKRFGAAVAVDAIDFCVPSGACVGLLGGNGAGKTTTLSMLLGLLTPSAGSIHCLGHDMARDRFAALARMNFSSPYVDLPHRLTARQNLDIFARLYGVSDRKRRLSELCETFDLGPLLDRPLGSLSAGQKTRVALAKALVNRPALLLLDEPTASLDPDAGDRARGWLEDYRRETGASILLASHNMAEVERLCDHVVIMRAGRIVDQGPPAALIARYGRATMEEVFLDVARGTAETATEKEATA